MSIVTVTARAKHYHGGAKGKLTGKTVQQAPAWRPRNIPETSDPGSKILISNLPNDVSDEEIVDLMRKTIGPVNSRDSFLIYNSKGNPRGMAVVAFTRGHDASKARARYNGKVIDGKRTIKLEVISDRDEFPSIPSASNLQQRPKTLFDRLGPQSPSFSAALPSYTPNGLPARPRHQTSLIERTSTARLHIARPPIATPMRKRTKKGPRRVKKSVADLDREIEEYAAARAREENGFVRAI